MLEAGSWRLEAGRGGSENDCESSQKGLRAPEGGWAERQCDINHSIDASTFTGRRFGEKVQKRFKN